MKITAIIYLTVSFMAVSAVAGIAFAGQRVVVIEMADGNHVVFAATPEEIVAADSAKAARERHTSARTVKPKPRVVTFEMGEGGMVITFPMNEKEIAAEDAAISRRRALHAARAREPEPNVVKIELPESGRYLVFPVIETGEPRPAGNKTARSAGN